DRRQRHEFGVGAVRDETRQRRFAGPRRAPQNHRVWTTGLQSAAQRRAGAEQVFLSDELIKRPGTQPIGQRSIAAVADRLHGGSRPITSTPAGGVKEKSSAAKGMFRFAA